MPIVGRMSVIDVMRTRLYKAAELGVPNREFLNQEVGVSVTLKCHVNARVAQAGREIEAAVRQLEYELSTPGEADSRLAARQALGE